jgi:deazaflavin-dependent oxidoreductase (nitroreductase family)
MDAAQMNAWNATIIEEFRTNAGIVGGNFAGAPMILVTHTGAKSGKTYTSPLVYLADGADAIIFASKAGADTDPHWYLNMKANPAVTVEIGSEKFAATAVEVTGEERDSIYATQAAKMPNFAEYAAKTSRVIPVVKLVRAA